MNFPIRPILSALLRNRTGAVLVALQVAVSLAVLVNATYVIMQRVKHINRPDGMATADMISVASTAYQQGYDTIANTRADIAWLNSLPDVAAAAPITGIPLSGGGSAMAIYSEPNEKGVQENINYYVTDEHGVAALGIKLSAGRSFRAEEILTEDPKSSGVAQVILTQAVASKLFPNQSALGKTVYNSLSHPSVVVGIIEHMHGAWVSWDKLDQVMLMPGLRNDRAMRYMIRAKPGRLDALIPQLQPGLLALNPNRVVGTPRTQTWTKARSYLDDRNMAIYLVAVGIILAIVTALGIFSLATFNVNARQRQVGTRRAVGARRGDILRYFLVENGMITAGGVLLGCLLALAAGWWLSSEFDLPRLDLYFLVGGILVVFLIGQLAALYPARRAAQISPAIATRNI
jgi:putative ABC transport system permease protein